MCELIFGCRKPIQKMNFKSQFPKALFCWTVITIVIIIYTTFKDVINTNSIISTGRVVSRTGVLEERRYAIKMKFILQWTSNTNVPFVYMGEGQQGLIDRKCPYTNCFVTSNKSYLGDYTNFDVIAFSGPEMVQPTIYAIEVPDRRSPHQKFVFACIESSHYYPVSSNSFDKFFNWTWTYKLDSEVRWGYIVIRDINNKIIGPNKDMNWMKSEDMSPVSDVLKKKLISKKKAAAWFVSNCFSMSRREQFVRELQYELFKYKHVVDIYGRCGSLVCSRDSEDKCDRKIADTYYFYLSFENAISEDYVTEKLLLALKNDAVPIVYGGANYTRFMPDGIYLNAMELGVEKLAEKINELMNDSEKYAEYFKWKNHYTYHKTSDSIETDEYCRFCEILNDEDAVKKLTVYDNFRDWWDPVPIKV